MTAYDRWLEAPYQEACERSDAIDEIAEQLMEDECNPHDVDVFLDAIDNACLHAVKEKLAQAIAVGVSGHEAVGKVVWDAVYQHCADQADSIAADRYNGGNRADYDPD